MVGKKRTKRTNHIGVVLEREKIMACKNWGEGRAGPLDQKNNRGLKTNNKNLRWAANLVTVKETNKKNVKLQSWSKR